MGDIFDTQESGQLTLQDFKDLLKQIKSWKPRPDPQPTWEIVDGIAYIYQFGYPIMMMPEAEFRQHFMGEDDE